MESNFIKERVVVREQLIKKNLKTVTNPNKVCPSTSKESIPKNLPERVTEFEALVNEDLKRNLITISQQVDTVCQTIADYLKVKAALKVFKTNPRDVRIQTNIGCNFYAQCHIEDASKIYICIGQDCYLHMELDEALEMIDFKEKQWTKQLDILQEKGSQLKAYIKIALEAMGRLYEMDQENPT